MRRALRCREYGLWLVGLLALSYCAFVLLGARVTQVRLSRLLEQVRRSTPAAVPARPAQAPLLARLEIPRLQLAAMILEGSDPGTLEQGVGHLPGTARPGEPGNVVLTGHRDTFFRSLRNIRPQDLIAITTPQGIRRYRVDSVTVVDPSFTRVLLATAKPTLTLVTCYPFDYLGAAPRRFIVRAEEVTGRPALPRPAETARSAPTRGEPAPFPAGFRRPAQPRQNPVEDRLLIRAAQQVPSN